MNKNIKNALLLGTVVAFSGNVMAAAEYNAANVEERASFNDRNATKGLRRVASTQALHEAARNHAETKEDGAREAAFTAKLNELYNARNAAIESKIQHERTAIPSVITDLSTLTDSNRLFVATKEDAYDDMNNPDNFRHATLEDLKQGTPLYVKHSNNQKWDALDTADEKASAFGFKTSTLKEFLDKVEESEKKQPEWAKQSNKEIQNELYPLDTIENPYSFNPEDAKWDEYKKLLATRTKEKDASFSLKVANELEPVVAAIKKYGFVSSKSLLEVLDEEMEKAKKNADKQNTLTSNIDNTLEKFGYSIVETHDFNLKKKNAAKAIGLTHKVALLEKKLEDLEKTNAAGSPAPTTSFNGVEPELEY